MSKLTIFTSLSLYSISLIAMQQYPDFFKDNFILTPAGRAFLQHYQENYQRHHASAQKIYRARQNPPPNTSHPPSPSLKENKEHGQGSGSSYNVLKRSMEKVYPLTPYAHSHNSDVDSHYYRADPWQSQPTDQLEADLLYQEVSNEYIPSYDEPAHSLSTEYYRETKTVPATHLALPNNKRKFTFHDQKQVKQKKEIIWHEKKNGTTLYWFTRDHKNYRSFENQNEQEEKLFYNLATVCKSFITDHGQFTMLGQNYDEADHYDWKYQIAQLIVAEPYLRDIAQTNS